MLLGCYALMPTMSFAQVDGDDASPVVTAPPAGEDRRPSGTLEVKAPEPLAPDPSQQLLDLWLDYAADAARRERLNSGANQLVGSAILLGIGIWAYVHTNPTNELVKGIGLSAVGASGVFLSVGIFRLAKKSTAELRFESWRQARGPSLTLRELGRYEGELRAFSREAELALKLSRWSNFALMLTGGLILGLTPAADLTRDGRTIGYVVGGVSAGLGLLGFGLSFIGSAKADYWKLYENGQAPPTGGGRRWGATPSVGRNYVGARLFGSF